MKRGFFAIIIGHILGLFYLVFNDKIEIELANFVITFFAFGAAIYAIYNQHQESKQAEENFKTEFALQKEAALKQETIGAWQVLANKASGNSGKKEAIEFLASQGMPLRGIDMSSQTHGGIVDLTRLFKDFQGDRKKINLMGAKFSKARLYEANFSEANLGRADLSGANLGGANFSEARLYEANFSGANLDGADLSGANLAMANFSEARLYEANFSGAKLYGVNFLGNKPFDDKTFIDCYCHSSDTLPIVPPGYKFEFEERTDENNQPIYPENNPNYRYIKLKIK